MRKSRFYATVIPFSRQEMSISCFFKKLNSQRGRDVTRKKKKREIEGRGKGKGEEEGEEGKERKEKSGWVNCITGIVLLFVFNGFVSDVLYVRVLRSSGNPRQASARNCGVPGVIAQPCWRNVPTYISDCVLPNGMHDRSPLYHA